MIYIRVDANEIIATGHVMRCMAIANALEKLGEHVTFLTADEKGKELIAKNGYEVICLHSQWDALENELDILVKVLKEEKAEKLIVDSYRVTDKYLKTLSSHAKVIYIDDLDAFEYPCDKIINYAVYADTCSYAKKSNMHNLLGPSYMPMRENFCNMSKKHISSKIEHILFLSGGADKEHFVKHFLEKFKEQDQKYQLTIISGVYNEDYEELCKLVEGERNITLKRNVQNIEEYMKKADVAISAGGTTLYELCACGTPTISYMLADNQRKNVEAFQKLGLIPYCGDVRKEDVLEKIFCRLKKWQGKKEEREEISLKMQKLVDGNGAKRLAKAILERE